MSYLEGVSLLLNFFLALAALVAGIFQLRFCIFQLRSGKKKKRRSAKESTSLLVTTPGFASDTNLRMSLSKLLLNILGVHTPLVQIRLCVGKLLLRLQ